jgi:hypothetical protein
MYRSTIRPIKNFAARHRTVYIATAVLLLLAGLFLRRSTWLGTAQLHTTMEVVATFLAMLIGIVALVRFYSHKENIFLFVGTGFIGTGFLDGYHALVSSPVFTHYFPSPPPSVIPWSGLASRLFLSVLLWLSWVFWRRESRKGSSARVPQYRVFFVVNTWTLACFLFFAVLPLPAAYSPIPVFHRPQEFVSIFFCLLALTGYLLKGAWKHDVFENCLVLSIILFVVHSIFMSSSARLYDAVYVGAHALRLSSYLCMFAGLILAIYQLFREQQDMLAERAGDLQKEITLRKSAEAALTAERMKQHASSTRSTSS